MPATADAILEDHEGRTALRFERRYPHPPERIWRALTDPDEMSNWHPSPARFEPRPGGTVEYLPHKGKPMFPTGEVIEFEPPRLLSHTWGDDRLRWEIAPQNDGCVLVLTHTFDDHFKAARDAAGWHLCLDSLAAELEGREDGAGDEEDMIPTGWRELNSAYEKRFGIPPEKATPPPTG